ncbi:SDR family oxidoreductase [Siccirubricoccus sp. KC 17139]|uniref:SDR family oxidoreductase n=1 Tax=Siccirubricoccus soli TaxID=2899147 RepID=A0ABT1D3K7_9PROT|nr:SDR family oxidoreductase [Siccirubricoccus soli]MCP2682644.1 SDR family oxidoreductase [Siccirubricoccus soli]
MPSAVGRRGTADAAIYVAGEHAMKGPMKSVALQVAGSGLRANTKAPSPADTDMVIRFAGDAAGANSLAKGLPVERLGCLDEFAAAIVFSAVGKSHFSGASDLRRRRLHSETVNRCMDLPHLEVANNRSISA